MLKRKLKLAAAAVAILGTSAFAQMGPGMMGGYGPGPGYGMGPGMMGGYGPGPGYGMGPGMMGGCGHGWGMGPGPMGGYGPGWGMGPGMMGGYGPGWGMGPGAIGVQRYGGLGHLDLSTEQRAKIDEIQKDVARKHWDLMGKMHEQGVHMHDLGPGSDADAARGAYQAMADAHKAMFELSLDARKRIEAVLTKDQLEQLRRSWRGG